MPEVKRVLQAVSFVAILLVSPLARAQDSIVRWYGEAGFTNAGIGNIALGFHFNPNLALEVGYRVSEDASSATVRRPATDAFEGFESALRLSTPLSRRLTLTSRFGVYNYGGEAVRFDAETAEFTAHRRSSIAPVLGIGLLYSLTPTWSMTIEHMSSDAFGASGRSSNGRLALGLRFTR